MGVEDIKAISKEVKTIEEEEVDEMIIIFSGTAASVIGEIVEVLRLKQKYLPSSPLLEVGGK